MYYKKKLPSSDPDKYNDLSGSQDTLDTHSV